MRKFLSLFAVLVLCSILAFSQTKVVTGKVTDQQGQPIPFASVRVKGSKQGVSADADGNFSIRVKPTDALVVTGTGITAKEVPVGEGTALNVTVARSSTSLTEVVVTSLGVQRQSKELGYATAKVNSKELTQAKVTDISTGLAGKVSGLQVNLVNNSVSPNTRIVLRGNRSITGNNQALLVVDGVPIDDVNYITKINPEDVENVNVLKGAVAAAIYGSKASNGVLIITTKHGTRGRSEVKVSNTISAETVSYMPKFQNTFSSYGGEGSYTNPDGTVEYVPYENQSYGPAYTGGKAPLGLGVPVFNADGTVNHLDTNFVNFSPVKNNRKDFFNTGFTNQFDVSYSSGDDKGSFYMGFQDVLVNGVVPKDQSRRDNIRIGGVRNYGRFKVDYSVSYNQQLIDIAGLSYNQTNGGVFSGRPLYFEIVNNPAHVPLTSFKDWKNNIFADPNGYFDAYATNPWWTIDNSRRKTNTYDLLGNLQLSYKVFNWLTVSDRIGVTQTTANLKYTRAGINFAPWAVADPWGAGNVPSSQKVLSPSEYDESFLEQRLNNDLIGAFDKSFGDFTIKGLVGFNFGQRKQTDMYLQGDALQFPGFYSISSALGVPGYNQVMYLQREYSIYEEVTIGYKDFLFVHGSNRDEWNSVLDPSVRHFRYPGVDASFVFTQAIDAFKNSKVLNYGKIRGGYTQVSNINLGGNPYGAYSLVTPYVTGGPATGTPGFVNGFPYGALGGYTTSTVYLNPLVKPEITNEFEVGLELGFLNDRIHFNGDIYQSKTKNQNLTAQVSPATGFTSKVVNAGLVTNQGLELDLNLVAVKTKDVEWRIGITYAHQKNLLNELQPGVTELQLSDFANGTAGVAGGIYAVQGKAYPVLKTTDWIRDSATGKVIVDPVTGMPTVDPNEKTYGTTNPTDLLGINTSVTWKGLTLAAVADYRGGNYIMNSIGQNQDFTGVSFHSAENGRQRFIFPNSVVMQGGKLVDNTTVAVSNGGNIGGAGFWPTVYTSGIGSVYITSA
ncbi:MAG TPA: SusC/RagA family TonB-linked outer membrane protein, partial [Puia sp.]|nr:SusC/RagA family TonB-linked outer membrane protein [Puia sp.]